MIGRTSVVLPWHRANAALSSTVLAMALFLGLAIALPAGAAEENLQAADNLFAAGRWMEAAEVYSDIAKKCQGSANAKEAAFRAAESLFRAARLEEALAAFEACGDELRARFRVANILYLLGRLEQAVARFGELLARRDLPKEIEGASRYFLARSLLSLGKLEESRKALEAAAKLMSGPQAAYLMLATGDVHAASFFASRDEKAFVAAQVSYRDALEKTQGGKLAPEALFRLGELFRLAGRAKDAAENYRRVAELYPQSPVALYARLGLALSAMATGEYETSASESSRVKALAPEPQLAAEATYVEGTALLAMGRYGEAAKVLEPFLQTGSQFRERALRRLGWAALASGRYDLTRKVSEELLSARRPEVLAEARYFAAEAALGDRRADQALEHLAAVIAMGPPELVELAEYRRAWALWELAQAREAAKAFEDFATRRASSPLAPLATALAARAYLASGDAALAAKGFRRAVAAFRDAKEEPELLWGAAVAEYMRGDLDAMASLTKEILDRHGDSARSCDAEYWFARCLLERKDLKAAASAFRAAAARAAGRRPQLAAAALLEAAAALERSGDRTGALNVAFELVTGPLSNLAPVEAVLWVAQGLRESARPAEAKTVLNAALARTGPDRPRLMYALAELARESGETDRAMELYDSAISEADEELRPAARLGKAKCLAMKGRYTEAEVILENIASSHTGWAKAASHVELGRIRLEEAARSEPERRKLLAEKARDDFMLVALLFEPEGTGEGARLCARALIGAAKAYALLERYASARDRLEQLLVDPKLSSLPEAREARVFLQQIGVKAVAESLR